MNRISRYKFDIWLIIPMIIMIFISIISILSAEKLLGINNLAIKQIIWYIVGFILIFIIMRLGNRYLFNNIKYLYIFGIILLIGLFFFGSEINNAKCWYSLGSLGTFQPSEFVKIILILVLAIMIDDFNNKYNNPSISCELIFLLKIMLVVLIPSILTFLQPDTGIVLIYLLITTIMLFIGGIRYRWFIILFSVLALILGFILLAYFLNQDLFINIFGTDFFLRIDRLLDWSNGSGYQLSNGMSAIGSSGFLGNGLFNTPIYFPEPQTDFIFAVYASNFGYIGSIFLILVILFFDFKLIELANKCKSNLNKYIIAGFIGMLTYQQFQNIGMTIGIMPITGITLPFISYGGSSLLSYLIMFGTILNISNECIKK